jgi:2-oxoglutarate dehydrogenase E2 component (dihydrolipoamide succinyltransferase)
MIIEIKVPEAGESITEVELAKWLAEDGDYVAKDQEIAEIDSDKATLTLNADGAGTLKIMVEEGSTVQPGDVIGSIDTSATAPEGKSEPAPEQQEKQQQPNTEEKAPQPAKAPKPEVKSSDAEEFTFSPQAQKILDDNGIAAEELIHNPDNKRITKKDILQVLAHRLSSEKNQEKSSFALNPSGGGSRDVEKIKMTTLRKKIAERLVTVKNQTAMLTTFNEVDMSAIMALREKYKDQFQEKYGVKPGLMSFFAKAVTSALALFPQVNGQIDGENIIIPAYVDLGIAVSTPKGLMVPVIRNAESKTLSELEKEILTLAKKARDNKITIEELTGGTFSITNGGVFGSMLSTPILNPPQSAILGMHNIVQRPVAIDGKVEIRPIMYVALSYDHRIIDGKESVGFLVKIKEFLENPETMILNGKDPGAILLGLQ